MRRIVRNIIIGYVAFSRPLRSVEIFARLERFVERCVGLSPLQHSLTGRNIPVDLHSSANFSSNDERGKTEYSDWTEAGDESQDSQTRLSSH